MRRSWIERIRHKIRLREYDMTAHATDEMAEDDLDIADVENAILAGRVVRVQRSDPRGNLFVLHGPATDATCLAGVVGRFAAGNRFLIVTVYRIG